MSIRSLAASIARATHDHPGTQPLVTAIPGLTLLRADRPTAPMPRIYRPALCIVAQGAKRAIFGDTTLAYRAGQTRVVGIEMPGIGYVETASADEPFLGVVVEFDRASMRAVLEELTEPLAPAPGAAGAFVADLGDAVTRSAQRLVELVHTPHAIRPLAPAIRRELDFWLLSGSYGGHVAKAVFGVDRSEHVVAAIHLLRDRFTETIRTSELAATARMSPSAFHRSFKAMTSMTPLQYQKQLRLLQARELLGSGAANAATAAYRVGYESASQFSREYARMFGAPPRRDRDERRMPHETSVSA